MKFDYQNKVFDTAQFSITEYENWISIIYKDLESIQQQISNYDVLLASNSPTRGIKWIISARGTRKYLKTVVGQLIHEKESQANTQPPSKSKIARTFLYIAQERLSVDVYNMIMSEATYLAENGKGE